MKRTRATEGQPNVHVASALQNVAEVAALRRDATVLYKLVRSERTLATQSIEQDAAHEYRLKLFDDVQYGDFSVLPRMNYSHAPDIYQCFKEHWRLRTALPCVLHCRNKVLHHTKVPAVCFPDGERHWYIAGQRHRDGGPAVEWLDGEEHWYAHGERHRIDGPAVVWADGTWEWFVAGKEHRDDGPAVRRENGAEFRFTRGERVQDRNVRTAANDEWWILMKRSLTRRQCRRLIDLK